MTTVLSLIIIFTLLFLAYLLIARIIKWYYKSRIARYSIESNYLSRIVISTLFAGFCVINPSISGSILNWLIVELNKTFAWTLMPVESVLSIPTLIAYGLLCMTGVFIINKSYEARRKDFIKNQESKDQLITENEINYPKIEHKEIANFQLRIKQLLELKYKTNGLKLKPYSKKDIFFGSFRDGLRNHFLIIKCENSIPSGINYSEYADLKIKELDQFISTQNSLSIKDSDIVDYYCCFPEKAEFFNFKDKIILTDENTLINDLINFKPYLENVVLNFENEKLFSATTSNSKLKTLKDTFIPPNFVIQEDSEIKDNLSDYINNWLYNCPDAKHLVLLGDYGMGKTSFLKYFSCELAKIRLTDPNGRVPVYISLTNCSPRHGGIDEKVKAFVAENLGVDYAQFEYLIHKGKVLFLLDGFDEMGFVGTHEDRFKQMNEIWQLALKNNKIIISGRPSYFPNEFEMKQALNIVEHDRQAVQTEPYCESIRLQELNEDQIKEYIFKYYPNKSEQYFDWLNHSTGLIELCRRPSMMHIIREMLPKMVRKNVDTIYTQGGAIDNYVEYWINRQESKKIQSVFPVASQKLQFIKAFFRYLAVDFFINDRYDITAKDLNLKFIQFLDNNSDVSFNNKEHKEGFENEIFTSYFIELKDNHFQFVHKSFFEYFVAKEIVNVITNKKYKEAILYKNWSNSIVNFVYDSIGHEYKNHKEIPALLLLRNKKFLAKFKIKTFKIVLMNKTLLGSIFVSAVVVYSSYLYFRLIDFSWYWEALLYIVVFIGEVFIGLFLYFLIEELISKNKKIKFIEKALKIAYIKGQFDIKQNIKLVIKLMQIDTPPQIPIENILFKEEHFKNSSFLKLKNVIFQDCTFPNNEFINCHFNEVFFLNCTIGHNSFKKCSFKNVRFDLCNIDRENSPIDLETNQQHYYLNFENCRFDSRSMKSIKGLIILNKLILEREVLGTDDFLEQIKN